MSPQVAPGGLRGTAPIQSAESSAKWAAAALRGSSRPQGRAPPGSAFTAAHGAGNNKRSLTKNLVYVLHHDVYSNF